MCAIPATTIFAPATFHYSGTECAASEATSIYDDRNSLWSAYQTLYRQWKLVFAIGAANRVRGSAPPSPLAIWKDWLQYQRMAAFVS